MPNGEKSRRTDYIFTQRQPMICIIFRKTSKTKPNLQIWPSFDLCPLIWMLHHGHFKCCFISFEPQKNRIIFHPQTTVFEQGLVSRKKMLDFLFLMVCFQCKSLLALDLDPLDHFMQWIESIFWTYLIYLLQHVMVGKVSRWVIKLERV